MGSEPFTSSITASRASYMAKETQRGSESSQPLVACVHGVWTTDPQRWAQYALSIAAWWIFNTLAAERSATTIRERIKGRNSHLFPPGPSQVPAHPVDEDVFGQAGVGILHPTEGIHHLPAVELLHHLLQATICPGRETRGRETSRSRTCGGNGRACKRLFISWRLFLLDAELSYTESISDPSRLP